MLLFDFCNVNVLGICDFDFRILKALFVSFIPLTFLEVVLEFFVHFTYMQPNKTSRTNYFYFIFATK